MAQNNPGQQLSDLLVTRGYDPEMLDSAGKAAPTAQDAEIFSFDFVTANGTNHGSVVVMLGDDKELTVFSGDNVGRNMDSEDKTEWYDFQHQLKNFATKNFMTFGSQNINKLKYSMQGQAALKEGLCESWNGTKNVSWNGGPDSVRLMIRHKRPMGVDEARFRQVESLFVETTDGERHRLSFRSLAGGRAMVEHVRQGGKPYDMRGQHIANMVEELNVLSRFRRASKGQVFEGDTANLVAETNHYYETMCRTVKGLSSSKGYNSYFESWNPGDVTEQDLIIEDIKTLFVQETIDSRIEQALPILARIQQQGTAMKEANIFEAWADRLVEGTWATPNTPEQKQQLIELLSTELPVGADATNAKEQLYSLFGDDVLFDQLQELADADANADARELVIARMTELANSGSDNDLVEVLAALESTVPEPQAVDSTEVVDTPAPVAEGQGPSEAERLDHYHDLKASGMDPDAAEEEAYGTDDWYTDNLDEQDPIARMMEMAGIPMAEGWKDEADDFTEWSNHVKEKLSKASPEQRLGLAKQLSQLEVKHFGSTIPGTFNKQTGKAQAGLGLTDTVRNALKYFNAEQTGIRQYYDQDLPAGTFGDKFGSVTIDGMENATPAELALMARAVRAGADYAKAAARIYGKTGTITQQDLDKIKQGFEDNANKFAASVGAQMDYSNRPEEPTALAQASLARRDQAVAESTGPGVDAKGRTQSQWIQLVKAKFPDGKMIQAKMPDGPVQVTLPDGRRLGWKKVEQAVAEGQDATTYTVAYKDSQKPGKSYSTQVKATSAAEAKAAFQEWNDTGRFTYLGSRPDVDTVYEGVAESAELNTVLKYAGIPVAESRVLDEAGETIDHILNRFKHEVKQFEQGHDLDSDLYEALFDYYSDAGEMPYGVAKARTGDPMVWVSDKLADHLGVNEGWKGAIAGGLAGGALGSVVPGLGTLAGSALGAYAGHKLGDEGFKDPDAAYKQAQKEKAAKQQTPPVAEGPVGSVLGGLAGAALTKTPGGAMAGARLGSAVGDAMSGSKETDEGQHTQHGMDANAGRDDYEDEKFADIKPMSFRQDPIQATTDRALKYSAQGVNKLRDLFREDEQAVVENQDKFSALSGQYGHSGKLQKFDDVEQDVLARLKQLSGMIKTM